jgi:hypothetical protein
MMAEFVGFDPDALRKRLREENNFGGDDAPVPVAAPTASAPAGGVKAAASPKIDVDARRILETELAAEEQRGAQLAQALTGLSANDPQRAKTQAAYDRHARDLASLKRELSKTSGGVPARTFGGSGSDTADIQEATASAKAQADAAAASRPMEYPMGLTPEQVRLGAGAVGAVGGPTLQRFVERHAGPDAAEAAQIRRTEAQARRAARAQQILDEYLMGHGVAPTTGRDKVSAILQGTVGDAGTTGRARTEGFNTETAQRAAAEKSAAARAKQLGLPSTSTVFADAPGMTATDNGVLAPRDVVQQRAEATAAVQAQEEARRAEQLRKITQQGKEYAARQVARETPGPLSRFGRALGAAVTSPITSGALGGLGAALSVPEALERYRSGDTSGAVIAALGGISGLASMVPGLGIPAAVVGAGTIPAMYLNDIRKGKIALPDFLQVPPAGNPMGN